MGDRLLWVICAFVGGAAIILTVFVLDLAAEKILEHRMRTGVSTAKTAWEAPFPMAISNPRGDVTFATEISNRTASEKREGKRTKRWKKHERRR